MALGSLVLLAYYHDIHLWILTASVLFFVIALAVPAAVIVLSLYGSRKIPAPLMRRFSIPIMDEALGKIPANAIFSTPMLVKVTFLQAIVFLLDSATLWAMLLAVGHKATLLVALPSLVVASMVATIGLVPLGPGDFRDNLCGFTGKPQGSF